MQSATSKFLTESEVNREPSFSQQALHDLEHIIEQSIDDSIQQPTERSEDHSYAQLSTAATCVKTRGKSASILIKRLRIEKNVNITTSRGETPHNRHPTGSGAFRFTHNDDRSGSRRSRCEGIRGSPLRGGIHVSENGLTISGVWRKRQHSE